MKVTLKDVAAAAGVSRSAVSRAFTPGASVSAATKARVMEAAKALGYTPSALASSLTTGKTKLIGLLIDDFAMVDLPEMLETISAALQAAGLHPILINIAGATEPGDAARLLQSYSVDGAILISRRLPAEFAAALRTPSRPVVHACAGQLAEGPVHTAGIEEEAVGRIAARTLLSLGYRRLTLVTGPEDNETTHDRAAGFLKVCRNRDIPVNVRQTTGLSVEDGQSAMVQELADGPGEAVFCTDDTLALGALAAIEDAGLEVPDDIGLLGLSSAAIAANPRLSLSTIGIPMAKIAAETVDILTAALEDPALEPQRRRVRCKVVHRASLAGSDTRPETDEAA